MAEICDSIRRLLSGNNSFQESEEFEAMHIKNHLIRLNEGNFM